jgi:hypothetical protein
MAAAAAPALSWPDAWRQEDVDAAARELLTHGVVLLRAVLPVGPIQPLYMDHIYRL